MEIDLHGVTAVFIGAIGDNGTREIFIKSRDGNLTIALYSDNRKAGVSISRSHDRFPSITEQE